MPERDPAHLVLGPAQQKVTDPEGRGWMGVTGFPQAGAGVTIGRQNREDSR